MKTVERTSRGREDKGRTGVDWKKYAAVTVFVFLCLFALWLLLRHGISVLMPFLLAWVLSLFLSPIAEWVTRKTRLPRKLSAAVILLLSLTLLVLLAVFALGRLFRELSGIFDLVLQDEAEIGEIIQQMVDIFSDIGKNIPFLSALLESDALSALGVDLYEIVNGALLDAIGAISAAIPGAVMQVVAETPSVLLFLLVFLISSFYFMLDGEQIYSGIRGLLPPAIAARTVGLRGRLTALLYRYLRVYLLLFLVTFIELLVGLLLLGRRYAFLVALVIAALDVLPVLGVGTVLLPWAAVLFALRDFYGAIGLLVLWGVVTVVRQILEPRLFGESFGIHPLLLLIALYAGLRLFGFAGLLVGPALAVFLKLLYTEVKGGRGSDIRV